MHPQIAAILIQTAALFAPPSQVTVSQWADEHRYLASEASAEPGRWKTRSYQREPMDCITDPTIRRVVLDAGTQLIKSSTVENAAGRMVDLDPGPILILTPRTPDAMYFAEERFDPMVRDTPRLQKKLLKNKKLKKLFRGSIVNILSAGSPANAASRAIKLLCCDEIDKFRVTSEGSIIAQARKRLASYRGRGKEILASSPTYEGSEIDRAYQQSDQREYQVKCPACGTEQSMMRKFYRQVRWNSSLETREEQAATALYYCENEACAVGWDDTMRIEAMEAGHWKANKPFNGVAGFWISELYSYARKLREIVLDFLVAKDSPDELRVFVNTSLAENFAEQGEAPDWEQLVNRREDYSYEKVPAGALVLAAGADVHPDRIEVEIVGRGRNRESWGIRKEIFHGRTSELVGTKENPTPWEHLEALMAEVYPHELGGDIHVSLLMIDSGNQSNDVYRWVRTQPPSRVKAIKGVDKGALPVGQPSPVDVNYFGKVIKKGLRIYTVVGPFFKAELYADLKKTMPTEEQIEQGYKIPTGYCHFPNEKGYGDEHFRQLCAEQLVTIKDKRGRSRREWQQIRARNEGLDCRVYAMAAFWELGLDRLKEENWRGLENRLKPSLFASAAPIPVVAPTTTPDPQPAPETKPSWMGPRKEWF